MPVEMEQKAQTAQAQMLSPETKKAVELFGKVFKRPGELSSLNNSIKQLNNAPNHNGIGLFKRVLVVFSTQNKEKLRKKYFVRRYMRTALNLARVSKAGVPAILEVSLGFQIGPMVKENSQPYVLIFRTG